MPKKNKIESEITEEETESEEKPLRGTAKKRAKEGRNPRTAEKIQIPASKQAKFKPGKGLKDAVNH